QPRQRRAGRMVQAPAGRDRQRSAGPHGAVEVRRVNSTASSRERWWTFQQRMAPYLFVAPFVVLFACFMLYPLSRSIVLSFYKASGPRELRFVGLDNYKYLLIDKVFWAAVFNTTYFAVLFLVLQIPMSLI